MNHSTSKVIMMCGPAGSGKSTLAKQLAKDEMKILSYDAESFQRGITTHPLPPEVQSEIKTYLDQKLLVLIQENKDVILDYSFWSKDMRAEYIALLKDYGIEPIIYYIKTPKEVVLERISKRAGSNQNDIRLSLAAASDYYDHFQIPTADEAEVIVIEGV